MLLLLDIMDLLPKPIYQEAKIISLVMFNIFGMLSFFGNIVMAFPKVESIIQDSLTAVAFQSRPWEANRERFRHAEGDKMKAATEAI